MEFTSNWYWCN